MFYPNAMASTFSLQYLNPKAVTVIIVNFIMEHKGSLNSRLQGTVNIKTIFRMSRVKAYDFINRIEVFMNF